MKLIKKFNNMDNEIISAIKYLAYIAFSWLGIDQEAFCILILLMCIDSVIGAIKAVRLGYEFRFSKLLWGFCLKLCFLIIPLVVALLGKQIDYDFSLAVNIVIIVLSVSEGYSIFGNIYSAKNKIKVKKIDVVSMLLKSLRAGLMNYMKKFIKNVGKYID